MHIEAAKRRDIEYCLGEDEPVGDYDDEVWLKRSEYLLIFYPSQTLWLKDWQAIFEGELFDRAGL